MARALRIAALYALGVHVVAAKKEKGLGCTAIAVDGDAAADGSAFAGMNADCAQCDPRIAYIPAREHPEGAKREIYIFSGEAPRFVGYGRGHFYEPKEGEKLSPSQGTIPEVRSTYAYWEGILPLMNEKGLTLGESSCASRLMNYPPRQAPHENATEGLVDLTNLMQIALERCATARCAVETMGAIADEYGFFPMVGEWSLGRQADGTVAFDDGGEAVTLADRTGEAWIFHVVGGVKGVAKSLWAAMRLPKGHAGFVANNFVLREVPEQQTEDWLFSPRLHEAARRSGLWSGEGRLDWSRVFAPDTVTFQSPAGAAPIPLYASLRQWRLVTLAAPKAYGGVSLPLDPLTLPSTLKVERKLGHQDVFAFLSDMYEGTEFDMTQGVLAGPFGNPFRLEGGPKLGQVPRGISIYRTSYSTIGQARPSEEPVLWFAVDTPATSVYVPFYPAVGSSHAEAYSTGTLLEFTRKSAFWAFDFVCNWASVVNWRHAAEHFVLPLRAQLHNEIQQEMPAVEAKAKRDGPQVLAEWQKQTQQRIVDRWWQLADELVIAYNDGNFNNATSKKIGSSFAYPEWFAREVGFNQDIHPIFVQRDYLSEDSCAQRPGACPSSYPVEVRSPLPGDYNLATATWLYGRGETEAQDLALVEADGSATWAGQLLLALALLPAGFAAGRVFERRSAAAREPADAAYLRLGA